MKIKITPSVLSGEVYAPASKSYAHRLIILACLSGKNITVKNVGNSKDVLATAECMKNLGADCQISGGDFTVKSFKAKAAAKIDCGESGSTLRFLLPVIAALGIRTQITGSEKLLSRPSDELVSVLNAHGAGIENFTVKGKISAGKYEIDGSVSSQYISGLLLAFSALNGESELIIKGKSVSENYVDITVDALMDFGVKVEKTQNGYKVFGGYKPKSFYAVEGDYSGAAFMLAAGAIGKKVSVSGLNEQSKQGDKKIIEILKKFGAKVDIKENVITVSKDRLKGIEVDCENIPDLAQIISVVAAFSEGKTVLKGISRLKYKESDRIAAITDMLAAAEIKCNCDGETLFITGGKPKGGVFDSNNDHRTAMSCAMLAAGADGNSVINCAEAVGKSYPEFFKDYNKIGGKTDVVI